MIQICCICKEIYGEKEPYEDKEYTHGYCPGCFKTEMDKLKKQMLEMGIQPEENPMKARKIRTNREEDLIYESQYKKIKREYGKKAADQANYGWGVDDYSIDTKVYNVGILSSFLRGNRIGHEWSEY